MRLFKRAGVAYGSPVILLLSQRAWLGGQASRPETKGGYGYGITNIVLWIEMCFESCSSAFWITPLLVLLVRTGCMHLWLHISDVTLRADTQHNNNNKESWARAAAAAGIIKRRSTKFLGVTKNDAGLSVCPLKTAPCLGRKPNTHNATQAGRQKHSTCLDPSFFPFLFWHTHCTLGSFLKGRAEVELYKTLK